MRAFIEHKLAQVVEQNASRAGFAARLQAIVDAYNAGSSSADCCFDELIRFAKDLRAESERHVREGLTEDELELFDLLKKDRMTQAKTQKVKLAAAALLHRLREESPPVLVQDWFKDAQSRLRVKTAVGDVLHIQLPESYDTELFRRESGDVFGLVLRHASRAIRWAA